MPVASMWRHKTPPIARSQTDSRQQRAEHAQRYLPPGRRTSRVGHQLDPPGLHAQSLPGASPENPEKQEQDKQPAQSLQARWYRGIVERVRWPEDGHPESGRGHKERHDQKCVVEHGQPMPPQRRRWVILIEVSVSVHGAVWIQSIQSLFQRKIACPDERTRV